jgi:hypothetical protein
MDFQLLGDVGDIELIAANLSIRERKDLKARFGGRRWRKLKAPRWCSFQTVKFAGLKYIGMRPTA